MGKIVYLKASGEKTEVVADMCPPFEDLQAFVGGYIQMIYTECDGQQAMLLMDEEGKIKEKPVNMAATWFGRVGGIAPFDYVVGDAVLLVGKDVFLD